jgi:2-polyprenyl-3-methyl-5-hydroxy-6-metoxy-1,4-benzoquinol methylase
MNMENLEHINCPFCNKNSYTEWASENNFTAVKCNNCGLVYVNPRPSMNSISEANKIGEHKSKADRKNKIRNLRSYRLFNVFKINSFKKRIKKFFTGDEIKNKVISWLDVGAGYGEFIQALKKLASKKSQIKGIEPNLPKVKVAQKLGLDITDKKLDEITELFEYISLINVFSHLPDPVKFISDLSKKLIPNGKMLIVTGNGADVAPEDYPDNYNFPDHLVFTGERHLSEILERAGFNIIRIKKYKSFIPENILVKLIKLLLSRDSAVSKGPFRSLWVFAQSKN